MRNTLVYLFPVILFGYSIYSYTQVDPNLVLSSNPYFWSFQQFMWQIGYHNRPLSTILYAMMIILLFCLYSLLLNQIRNKLLPAKKVVVLFLLSVTALLPSYPALSHDVFNYLMNAKIMAVYQSSPYAHAAWDFSDDPWLKFMNNIEVTTPYGYIWTGLGYLTYLAAFGDLQLGLLAFRLLALISVAVIAAGLANLRKRHELETAAFFLFNPLVLTEAINNMHNDIVMMALFIGGLALFSMLKTKKNRFAYGILGLFWAASVLTKLVTIIVPAIYILSLFVKRWIKTVGWPELLTCAFIAIMFFDGSQRFYSWYLLWAFSIVPLTRSTHLKNLMIGFSLTGCLSYLFYLNTGQYSPDLVWHRTLFFFSLPVLYTGWWTLSTVRIWLFRNLKGSGTIHEA